KALPVYNTNDILVQLDLCVHRLIEEIETYTQGGSGWVFKKNIESSLKINKLMHFKGSSYIPLPDFIANKKCTINPKNEDQKCFIWCIIEHDYPSKSNVKRITKEKMSKEKLYDMTGINYPVSLDKIPKFEKQNNKAVNVFSYDI